jgi:hypothetical protein
MFSIRFGAHLDGADCLRMPDQIGQVDIGPNGFLQLLEIHLGLGGVWPNTAARAVEYRAALQAALNLERFYSASFTVDELGTSAELLRWRDALFMAGWDGRVHASFARRLADLAAVEAVVPDEVKCSTGERLRRVVAALESRSVPIESLRVVDSETSFPLAWRRLLYKLGAKFEEQEPAADGGSNLAKLQTGLLDLVAGKPVSPIKERADGSVRMVQSETRLVAGRWVAETLRRSSASALLLAEHRGEMLDHILESAGLARNGFATPSAFRPSLQVLPLVLALVWEPLDIHAALEFLSHPVCPVPRYARERLAEQMARCPGLHRASFGQAIADIRGHYGDRSAEVEERIDFWLFAPRHDASQGAPTDALAERVEALRDFFVRRMGAMENEARAAFAAAHQQCLAVVHALRQLEAAGRNRIGPVQLRKLVSQATSIGTTNPQRFAELGCTGFSDSPGAVVDPCDHVFWWQFSASPSSGSPPWTRAETAALAAAGVEIQSSAARLATEMRASLRPVLSARRQLTLVLPPASEEVHPLWQLIRRVLPDLGVEELEPLLLHADPELGIRKIARKPLPARRRWWTLPAGSIPLQTGRFSFTSLDQYLNNPSQWVLGYAAALRPSRLLSVADLFTLSGSVGHRVVERLFSRDDALSMSDEMLVRWIPGVLEEIVLSEAAIFLLPAHRARMRHLRDVVLRTVVELRKHVREAGATKVEVERSLEGRFRGGQLMGYADLVLTFGTGEQAIVDMKWSGGKKYPDKLARNRHLQLTIYGGLLEQDTGKWPRYAYYLLEAARMLTHDREVFARAQVVAPQEPQTLPQLWKRFENTWEWRNAQLRDGRVELVFDDIEIDDVPPDGLLEIEVLPPQYNPYLNLSGWAEEP